MTAHPISLATALDTKRTSRLQIAVLMLCVVVGFVDGYDVQAIAYVAPVLRHELHLGPVALGQLLAAASLGTLVGAVIWGPVADRIGRRPTMVGNVFGFGLLTWLTAFFARDITTLLVVRFLAGICLSGGYRACYPLVSEFFPHRRVMTALTILSFGYTIGAGIGGIIAAFLIPRFGWESVLYLGSAMALALGLALTRFLPESIRFLVLTAPDDPRIAAMARRINPGLALAPGTRLTTDETAQPGLSVVHLFKEGRAGVTAVLWVMSLMNFAELYFMLHWMPAIVNQAGLSLGAAVSTGTVASAGTVTGSLFFGRLVDRSGKPYAIAIPGFLCGGLSLLLLGQAAANVWLVMTVVYFIGFFVGGMQLVINGLCTTSYPTFIRATGSSWGIGMVGSFGGAVSPILVGLMLSDHWSIPLITGTGLIPAAISATAGVAMLTLGRRRHSPTAAPAA